LSLRRWWSSGPPATTRNRVLKTNSSGHSTWKFESKVLTENVRSKGSSDFLHHSHTVLLWIRTQGSWGHEGWAEQARNGAIHSTFVESFNALRATEEAIWGILEPGGIVK
jgi:hypothetical protein